MRNYYIIAFLLVVFSCTEEPKKENPFLKLSKEERKILSQNSIKKAVKKEQQQIKAYIKRKGGKFTESKTGVQTLVINAPETNGNTFPTAGNLIEIKYCLTLLNGDTIFKKDTKESFVLEYADKESGLHEALKTMNVGTKAIVIIPSYRAHGLVGNDKKIPALSTLVYELELTGIE